MLSAAKKQNSAYQSSASVVDGKLILSFPNAKTPVVWQLDMAEVKASALEVKGDKDPFVLVLRTTKGEAVDVAPFTTKEEAVEGLVAVTTALQNAHGLIRPASKTAGQESLPPSYHPAHNKPGKKRWGLLLGAVIVLGTLLFLINSVTSTIPMPPASGDYAADGNAAAPQNGVPMSAEDFFK
ncbi:MAG: hypothetical protein LRY57_00325 [Alphaproteobacteria bacterium]|nr:hypothetical protein [Alphaproteobacteria bacterium]